MPLPFEGVVRALARGERAPCYLLAGPDGLQQRAVLDALAPVAGMLGPSVLDGAEVSAADVVGALRSPTLGGGRLVIVEAPPWVVATPEGGRGKGGAETELLTYLDAPAPGAVLVLRSAQAPDRRRRLVRRVREVGVVLDTVPPKDGGDWLRRQARAAGLQLPADLLSRVVQRLEGETCERIAVEVRKLAQYGEGLDVGALDRLLPPPLEEHIYTLVDACLAGDAPRVFGTADALLAQGEAVPRLLFSLAAQLRTIAQVAGDPEAAGQGGLHPFVLRKAADQARRLNPAAWAQASRAVWEAEFAWKTGRWTEATALDNALAGVLAAARGLAGTAAPPREPLGW